MDLQFTNKVKTETKRVKTVEGYLDVPAVIYRSGIFNFSVNEAPFASFKDELPKDILSRGHVRLFVPEEAIKDGEFLASAAAQPVTNGHPSEFVNSSTNKYLQLGMSKGPARAEPASKGLHAVSDLRITDADMVNSVEKNEVTEVSIGNKGRITLEPGKTGAENYDGTLDTIRVNHIAIVNRGRGGRDVRLLNDQKEIKNMEFVTKVINGIEVSVAKDNEKLVDSLVATIANNETQLGTVKAELENEKTKSAKLEKDLENSELSEEKLDELVNERSTIIETAKRIAPKVDTKLGNKALMVAAVKTVNADLVSDDSPIEVVNAVFSTLAKTNRSESRRAADSVNTAIVNGETVKTENADTELETARKERSENRRKKFKKVNYGN